MTNQQNVSMSREKLVELLATADESQKKVIYQVLGEQVDLDITDRIKTVDDAFAKFGMNTPSLDDFSHIKDVAIRERMLAYYKLSIVANALNDGEEIELNSTSRRDKFYQPLFVSDIHEPLKGKYKGADLKFASSVGGLQTSILGIQIAYKDQRISDYAGNQFIDLYRQL